MHSMHVKNKTKRNNTISEDRSLALNVQLIMPNYASPSNIEQTSHHNTPLSLLLKESAHSGNDLSAMHELTNLPVLEELICS